MCLAINIVVNIEKQSSAISYSCFFEIAIIWNHQCNFCVTQRFKPKPADNFNLFTGGFLISRKFGCALRVFLLQKFIWVLLAQTCFLFTFFTIIPLPKRKRLLISFYYLFTSKCFQHLITLEKTSNIFYMPILTRVDSLKRYTIPPTATLTTYPSLDATDYIISISIWFKNYCLTKSAFIDIMYLDITYDTTCNDCYRR